MCSLLGFFSKRLFSHSFRSVSDLMKYKFSDVWLHCHGYKNVSLGHALATELKANERERERGGEGAREKWKSCTVVCTCNNQAVCSAELHETRRAAWYWGGCGEQSRTRSADSALNVTVFNTFRFFKAIWLSLRHHPTQAAHCVCSWSGLTVLQRSIGCWSLGDYGWLPCLRSHAHQRALWNLRLGRRFHPQSFATDLKVRELDGLSVWILYLKDTMSNFDFLIKNSHQWMDESVDESRLLPLCIMATFL